MSLSISINHLENCVIEIESQLLQAQNHNSNANMASAGSVAAYFLTNNSENRTVRNVGQLAAIGGVVLSASQRGKANAMESLALLNIGKAINIIERDCKPYIRNDINIANIKCFLDLFLRCGSCIDVLLKKTSNKLKWTGHLGKRNQELLLKINQIDIINKKLRYNVIMNFIDRQFSFNDPSVKFINAIGSIDRVKMRKEGLMIRIGIIFLSITGALLANHSDVGQFFIFSAGLLWAFNHFFPILPETKKLKVAVSNFHSELEKTMGISSITLR